MTTNRKLLWLLESVLIVVLGWNALRLIFGFFEGDPHPLNIAAAWLGSGPVMDNLDQMSYFSSFKLIVSLVTMLLIYVMSAYLPVLVLHTLLADKKTNANSER